MKLLFFDTETTGLPKSREPAYKGPNNWPHIVSISWVLQDGDRMERKSFIIRPNGWTIPEESTRIHGITHDRAVTEGSFLSDVMLQFLLVEHDYIIAHNLDFDLNVIINACLWDLGIAMPDFGRRFCTMKFSTDLLRLPLGNGRSGWKSPKLSELYKYVMNKDPQGQLHSSDYDTELLVEIVNNFRPFKAILGLLGPADIPVNETNQRTRTIIL